MYTCLDFGLYRGAAAVRTRGEERETGMSTTQLHLLLRREDVQRHNA